MKIYLKLEPPYEWVRVSGASVDAFGEVLALSEYPINPDDDVIGVVSGKWVTTHQVALPTKTRKQFNQALPFALEDSISEDISHVHFVCPEWVPASNVTVLCVAKEKMREWQALANQHNLPIVQLLPDHALLPFHDSAQCSIALHDDTLTARHVELGGVSIDESLLDVWLMDIPVSSVVAVNNEGLTQQLIERHPNRDFRFWQFGEKMRHWLEYTSDSNIDLWSNEYRPKISRTGNNAFFKPLMLIVTAALLYVGYDIVRYYSLQNEINRLDQKMVSTLLDVFPEADGVAGGDARVYMQRAINRGQAQSQKRGVHEAIADMAGVLKRMQITLIELNYQNSELVIICILKDFSQVDALTKQFNARKSLSASLQGSSAEDGRVIATYSLSVRS